MGILKLWIVERKKCSYDEYIGFVCAAETEQEARSFHPSGDESAFSRGGCDTWVTKEEIGTLEVRMIGDAAEGVPRGVLFDSFKAA